MPTTLVTRNTEQDCLAPEHEVLVLKSISGTQVSWPEPSIDKLIARKGNFNSVNRITAEVFIPKSILDTTCNMTRGLLVEKIGNFFVVSTETDSRLTVVLRPRHGGLHNSWVTPGFHTPY